MRWVIQVAENRERDIFAERVARTHITSMIVRLRIRDLRVGTNTEAEENVGHRRKLDVSLINQFSYSWSTKWLTQLTNAGSAYPIPILRRVLYVLY